MGGGSLKKYVSIRGGGGGGVKGKKLEKLKCT